MHRGCHDEVAHERRSAAGYAWLAGLTFLIGSVVIGANWLGPIRHGHTPDYAWLFTAGIVTFVLTGLFIRGFIACSVHAKVAEVKRAFWPLQLLAWLFWRR